MLLIVLILYIYIYIYIYIMGKPIHVWKSLKKHNCFFSCGEWMCQCYHDF